MAFGRRRRFKTCPYCGWEVRAEAVKCRYCGHLLADAPAEKEACWPCRLLAGTAVFILLVGVAVLIFQASGH